ncbi:MAG: proteasome-activating nucleotidase [Candidatus Thalassarchaeum betae]|uniref:Proteasome-activating nucleotidase n=1 Tax=Candidatus Thalassarchaeum betae TaxID=2599289 RepID=A0A2V3HS29_9ARCH|nr:MAG: proteasome-activating nucleotidase [Candidatus Thalassoarchaea betae]PXF26870.1 MAG: proteasome-activating nucleotidase [Euryarchaeota archaeon]HIC50167.1 AAA family ATPase [Candidatus Poseidoniales archaeon]
MASEVDAPPLDKENTKIPSYQSPKRSIDKLQVEMKELSEKAQQLLTEKLFLENECAQLKKRANRLDEELRNLRTPPYVIGFIQDRVGDNAVVRNSNGTVFLVSVNRRLDESLLIPGARVALNQDSLSIIEVLDNSWDPLVSGTEIIEKPLTTFSDIGGLDEQIKQIRQAIELPFERPEAFREFGIEPPKGVLITGPPGTGKTMLAKAVANSTEATFLGLVGSELAQKYIGEGGRMVRELFDLARKRAPAIIFIDEIDAIGSKRLDMATSGDREVQRTLMQLLAELDGFETLDDVKVIAATNRPELLDVALLRPGRFDRIIDIELPNSEGRQHIFEVHCNNVPLDKQVNIRKMAIATEGYSGAEIKSIIIEAGMSAIADYRNRCSAKDFSSALTIMDRKRKDSLHNGPDSLYS